MCQLLGINSVAPSDVRLSFRDFCRRGGCTDIHAHGWGLGIYQGPGLKLFLEPQPCCYSPVAAVVQEHHILTCNMMAHIRYATQGAAVLENVHPFSREMWGMNWCFAHNGAVPLFSNFSKQNPDNHPLLGKTKPEELTYHAIGDTDSEAVFVAILNAIKAEYGFTLPTLPQLFETLHQLCDEIILHRDAETIFNFLLACGDTMFAYSWPGSRPDSPVWNGLHYIVRNEPNIENELNHADYSITFPPRGLDDATSRTNIIAIITTEPLSNEGGWTEMKRGELLMFNRGVLCATAQECETIESLRHGLCSKCVGKSSLTAQQQVQKKEALCSKCLDS